MWDDHINKYLLTRIVAYFHESSHHYTFINLLAMTDETTLDLFATVLT